MKLLLRITKIFTCIVLACTMLGIVSVFAINARVTHVGGERILTAE